jgi:hypothetical protein
VTGRSTAVIVLSLGIASCTPTDPCAVDEPSYGGLGNDEVWLVLKDAKAKARHEGDFPSVTSPTDNETLPAGDPPTFSWSSPLKIAAALPAQPLLHPRRSFIVDVISGAGTLVIPSARAHLPPVSSDAYLLEVLVPARACPVSIATTELSHVLDAESWATLEEAAGQPLTLQLTSAYLASGRITEGPFAADNVTFKVE